MFANWERETPLTEAVIQNDQNAIAALMKDPAQRKDQNFLGFNGIEIAQFLDQKKCLNLIQSEKTRLFSVRIKGEKTFTDLTEKAFEARFGVHYLHHNKFGSYSLFKRVIHDCPEKYQRPPEADIAGYAEAIFKNETPKFQIDWIDETWEYGLFAGEAIPQRAFVGVYLGELKRVAFWLSQNDHSILYPSSGLVSYAIDAETQGNEMRFINHSTRGNLTPRIFPDRGLLHFFFIANRDIAKGEQLFWNYGPDFWSSRNPPIERKAINS